MSSFLPNLFILGAAKCGTTTIHYALSRLPDFCMSSPKEPFFFEAYHDRGLDFYRQHWFANWQGQPFIGEARHRNLYLPYVPARIHATNPDAWLIVAVRNPVERAYSHWFHHYSRGWDPLPFKEAIVADAERISTGVRVDTPETIAAHVKNLGPEQWTLASEEEWGAYGYGSLRTYLDTGYYMDQIERYLALFPRAKLHVVLLDDLERDPAREIAKILSFLGADPERNPTKDVLKLNTAAYRVRPMPPVDPISRLKRSFQKRVLKYDSGKAVRPLIDEELMRWLVAHFDAHNRRLGRFLQRDLSAWSHPKIEAPKT